MRKIFAFELSVKGTNWKKIINHETAGKAKYSYWLDVRESWPDIPFTDIRCRKIGNPYTSDGFVRNAIYRGRPEIKCGQRVVIEGNAGVIIGYNSSANFDILFDEGPFDGLILNCHPDSCQLEVS